MKLRLLKILLKKEVWLMMRNPFIPKIIIAIPFMAMLILPLVANLDVKDVGVAVVDNDRSILSRRIVADVDASEFMEVKECVFLYDEALQMVENGDVDVILSIPRDYSVDLARGSKPHLSIDANGVNATKGMLGSRYVANSVMATLARWQAESGHALDMPQICVMNYYNPTLNFRNYMIPALMVVLIIIICGFLPTLNLVSEKEAGTIEAMNVTPVGKLTFVLSKLIPYWLVGILVVTVGMIIGWLVYGLAPAGNIGAIYLAAILFSLVMSGLGVAIANKSATILQSIFVMFAFIVIFQLMGGLFTPISSMPQWAQYITYAVPPRYFIEIMRSVYLKGASVADLWPQYLALAAFATTLCLIAATTYKKRE
ncbi:MAG: ABC transporter permease [Muribaculaceae bacterium]